MPGLAATEGIATRVATGILANSLLGTSGTIRYVSSVTGSDTSGKGTIANPYATIDYAIGLCTASKGDVVCALEGHAETITAASAINLDVAGVAVVGLGRGTLKPTITFGTNTTATIAIGASNCTFRNFRLVNNIDSLACFITGGADFVYIEDCEFIGSSTKEYLCGVSVPTTYDNWEIRRCRFVQPTDPAGTNGGAGTGAIYLVDSENVLVEECEFRGCFETAFIHNKTTAAANLWVRRCYGQGSASTADSLPFVLVTTATGGCERCSFTNPNETATTEATLSGTFGAGFFNFQSYFGNDGGGGQNAIASQSAAS